MDLDSKLVISGVAGRYPESENLDHFWSNLLNGIEMCTLDDRAFAPKIHEDTVKIGKILDAESFDADFFKLSDGFVDEMGASSRLIIEVIYEAIYDSGTLSNEWKSKKTGLFFARCTTKDDILANDGYDKFFLGTVLPYICQVFNINGGAADVDTACASMATALDVANRSITSGQCDQAIVAGTNTSFYHEESRLFRRLKMISKDGTSKCLDANADGYCRSESIVAIIVQRKCDAKRVYAAISGFKTNCDGYKPEGITFPKLDTQFELFQSTLKDLSLDPLKIDYIEAHITGTQAGDPIECASIQKAYRPDSVKPLYLGCLKSNIGHSETTAFGNAISKVVKIFQTGLIPANINYRKPNPRIEGLINGILLPVLENKPFDGDIIPVHALGFGGVNAVAILEAYEKRVKEEDKVLTDSGLPCLVQFCNRTLKGLESIVDFINRQKGHLTKYTLALINDLSKDEPLYGFNHRGYLLLDNNQSIIHQEFREVNEVSKPWFIFTPVFQAPYEFYQKLITIPNLRRRLLELNSKVLKSKGINIIGMINNEEIDFTSQLVSSTAIQMVLYDFISKDLKIVPNGIIGHSLGSIAAAYADDCLNDELAISIAYQIASVCSSAFTQQPGLMVNINLPWKQIEMMNAQGVDIASYESKDWTIISGPKETIESFIAKLDDKIDRKILHTNNIPFHSSLIDNVSKLVALSLAQLNIPAKYTAKRLIFTSLGPENLSAYLINQDFFTHLLALSCNLQKVLQDLPTKIVGTFFGNMQNDNENFNSLLEYPNEKSSNDKICQSIGKLYLNGLNPAIENLYEKVNYPVPRETQSLGHLIKWNHDKKYRIPGFSYSAPFKKFIWRITYDLDNPDHLFLSGHAIDGRKLFPATAYLYVAWLSMCRRHFLHESKTRPIEFQRVTFHRAIHFGSTKKFSLYVKSNEDTMSFILYSGDESDICVTGQYRFVNEPSISYNANECQSDSLSISQKEELVMDSKDIYKELRIRGYDYSGEFQGVVQASSTGEWAFIKDTGNWISFADSCMQVYLMGEKSRALKIPSKIDYVYMNPVETEVAFNQLKKSCPDSEPTLRVSINKSTGISCAPGFIVKGVIGDEVKRRLQVPGNRREYRQFDPFECDIQLTNRLNSIRNKYSDQCLKCIEILKGNVSLEESTLNTQEIEKLLSTVNKTHTLLSILYEAVKKFPDESIKAVKYEYQKKSTDLLYDILFLDPLEHLIQRLINNVYENFVMDKLDAVALNFLQIPSEVSLNNDKLSSQLNVRTNYVITDNYADMVDQADSIFSKLDLAANEKITKSESTFELVFFRDISTYLPVIASKSPESVPKCDINVTMKVIFNTLKEGGFCIMITRTKLTLVEQQFYQLLGHNYDNSFEQISFKRIVEEIGFTWIGFKHLESEGFCAILLQRPFKVDSEQKLSFIRITLDDLNWIDEIKKASQNKNHKIWLIGGGHDNGIIGLTKCLNRDPYGFNVRCYYDPSKSDNEEIRIPDNILAKDYLINIVDENGAIGTFIYQNIENLDEIEVKTNHCYADIRTKGDLSSARWYQSYHSLWNAIPRSKLRTAVELATVYYGALNFKDVMVATGRVPRRAYPHVESISHKLSIGMEFSGIDSEGKRIMGICESGSIGSSLLLDQTSTKILVPDEWTLADAATVPVVYLTAYYGLFIRGDLKSGEVVLIHAGSGGVGQAAISICLARNCEVFTTVGNQAKRDFIKQRFPSIDDEHIGFSRSTSFEEMILRQTNGRGVDLVLNSLSDDKLTASLRCLADFGRFIEIGKYDMIQNTLMDNITLENNKTFHACCLAHLRSEVSIEKNPDRIKLWDNLIEFLKGGMESGEVKPLPKTIFEMDQLEESFRFMATGKHIGKVLIQIRDEQECESQEPKIYKAIGQSFFDLNKVYIITGGLGGIGLELAYWMSLRGATNLILTSRTGIKDSYQRYMIDRIMSKNCVNVKVFISNEDCHTYESTERLINMANEIGLIGGIFHLAMVLKDALFENQKVDTFLECVNPKAIACRHLDKLSRLLPYSLDQFVCFSSVATSIGNAGQSNYCFANSSMEQICANRRSDGLHGLAIQLGIIGDVGAIADYTQDLNRVLVRLGVMRLPLLLCTLDKLLLTSYSNCLSIIIADEKASILSSDMSLKQMIFHILGITDINKVDPDSSLGDLGLDSLMAIEIKQGLETKYDYSMTTQDIHNLKVSQMTELEQKLKKAELNAENNSDREFTRTKYDPMVTSTEIFVPLNSHESNLPVFYFPEISGSFTDIRPVFDQVSKSVEGVSWVKDMEKLDSMDQVTDYYVDALMRNYPGMQYFNLIGYSLGGCIAFQVACKLQKKLGLTCIKNLILLDTSFDGALQQIAYHRNRFQASDDNSVHAVLLASFITTYYALDSSDELEDRLLSMKTKNERHDFVNTLISKTSTTKYTPNQFNEALDLYYMKLKALCSFEIDDKFYGNINLLRATEKKVKEKSFLNIEVKSTQEGYDLEDYGLSKYITGKVAVHSFKGNHETFIKDDSTRIAAYIDAILIDIVV